ncbi:MAG: hypothetical protein LBL46_03935 [Rickettsiales bacterium]|jgi:hypothetical protein|nr:hypothetical protein [Rickettsiales bacterium]
MKKLSLFAMLAVIAGGAFAEPPMGGGKGPGGKGGFGGPEMTDEQKACVEAAACPKFEKPKFEPGQKPEPGKKPEMTEEMKAARECQKKAMESCGVKMPERPDRPEGGFPGGPKGGPDGAPQQ